MDGLELDPEGRRIVTAGVTDRFKVTAKDAFGNQLQEGGLYFYFSALLLIPHCWSLLLTLHLGLNIEGVLGGTADVQVMAADNGDGSYEITYTPTKAGPYQLEVKIEGQPMGGKVKRVYLNSFCFREESFPSFGHPCCSLRRNFNC